MIYLQSHDLLTEIYHKSMLFMEMSILFILFISTWIYHKCTLWHYLFLVPRLIRSWDIRGQLSLVDPGGCRRHMPPPNRIQFFRFCICFCRKAYVSEVGTPNRLAPPPQRKILDPLLVVHNFFTLNTNLQLVMGLLKVIVSV